MKSDENSDLSSETISISVHLTMLSACLACLTSSLWIERTGSNSFVIKGKNKANSKVFDFTKATYAKVKKENGDIVDVNEVPNLNCKFEFENHEHYIVGKYYLTNTADKRAKFDFSHGIEFNPSILDGELSASYYENYGVAIYFYLLPDYGDYVTMTWVSMSHPEVTDINLFHYNDKGDKIFFEGNSMYNEQWFYSSWFANSWIDLWIEPHQTIMKSFVIYDDFYDTPRFKLDTTLIKEEIASDEKIHLKGRFWHKVEGRDIKGRYEIINKKDGSIAQKLSLGEMKTTTSDYTVAFDIYTDPLPIGEYTIKVIASYITYDSIYDIDFKVYQGNVRLKVLLTKPDSKYPDLLYFYHLSKAGDTAYRLE